MHNRTMCGEDLPFLQSQENVAARKTIQKQDGEKAVLPSLKT